MVRRVLACRVLCIICDWEVVAFAECLGFWRLGMCFDRLMACVTDWLMLPGPSPVLTWLQTLLM